MEKILHRIAYKLFRERLLAWRDRHTRRRIETLRREGLVLSPVDAALATLRLHGMLPTPLVALDAYGKFGLRKTLDFAGLCRSLDFYEFEPAFARLARNYLPPVATVHCEDTCIAVNEGRLPRRDYNFVMIDNPGGIYGPGYCEHFDLFPRIYDYLAPLSVIVVNIWRATNIADLDREHISRRRAFYGAQSDEEAMLPPFDLVVRAYQTMLPASRKLDRSLLIPHPIDPARPYDEVYFLAIVIRARDAVQS